MRANELGLRPVGFLGALRRGWQRYGTGTLFVAPFLVLFAVFYIIPVFTSIVLRPSSCCFWASIVTVARPSGPFSPEFTSSE